MFQIKGKEIDTRCYNVPGSLYYDKYYMYYVIFNICSSYRVLQVALVVKNLPAGKRRGVQPLGQEDPLEEGMATHFCMLAWRIPWTEEPGGLQSIRLQRVDMSEATQHAHNYIALHYIMLYYIIFLVCQESLILLLLPWHHFFKMPLLLSNVFLVQMINYMVTLYICFIQYPCKIKQVFLFSFHR